MKDDLTEELKSEQLSCVDIINETVKFYSEDVSRRSLSEDKIKCMYRGSSGNECAFSRYVDPSSKKFLIEFRNASSLLSNVKLLKSARHLKSKGNFWNNLQSLHDNNDYWDSSGLSLTGKQQVEHLIDKYTES